MQLIPIPKNVSMYKLVDTYLHMRVAKNLWDALEAKFGATNAGSEIYVMEQFHDYKMVDNHSILDQALEEPSAPFTCESFALEFCSTLR